MISMMCRFGWHDWNYFWKCYPVKPDKGEWPNKFLKEKYGTLPFKHRKCKKCNRTQYRTRAPIFTSPYGEYDPNKWKDVC